ncbi:riboflavin synthase [bacterium]|nr:riboflavin synthase [bacterium]
MFTGIIEKLARVSDVAHRSESTSLKVDTGYSDLSLGESIALNGVCLTVAEVEVPEMGRAIFYVSPETLAKTNLGEVQVGTILNVERALQFSARLSGHIVQGHVDGLAKLNSVTPRQESYEMVFDLPRELGRYCINKGSITLNGTSLTINSLRDEGSLTQIQVMIIPHTWIHTNLSNLRFGQAVNCEVDLIAKYIERLACQK